MENKQIVSEGIRGCESAKGALSTIFQRIYIAGVIGKRFIHVSDFGFSYIETESQLQKVTGATRLILDDLLNYGYQFKAALFDGNQGIFITRARKSIKGSRGCS